jgi:hypothetical protein
LLQQRAGLQTVTVFSSAVCTSRSAGDGYSTRADRSARMGGGRPVRVPLHSLQEFRASLVAEPADRLEAARRRREALYARRVAWRG